VDLSGIIFVALAVAWAVYLIPKALKHHDEVVRSRSVDRFSQTMRVLARREPVSRRDARLVVSPARPDSVPVVTTKASSARPSAAVLKARREASRVAARRRRRVLGTLLFLNAAVAGVAAYGLISWWWMAAPAALVVAWLVACRLMVRQERGQVRWLRRSPSDRLETKDTSPANVPDSLAVDRNQQGFDEVAATAETSVIGEPITDPSLWDPLPVTLPTYVTKETASRSVRTIELDDSGVWTSGHTDEDSRLAREADEAERTARAERAADDGDDSAAVAT
jgi:hypothetical protein